MKRPLFRRWPFFVPAYWRRITPPQGLFSYSLQRDWILVLSSRAIPFRRWVAGNALHIYVPALLENLSLAEIDAYQRENRKAAPARLAQFPRYRSAWLAPFLLAGLVVFYATGSKPLPGIARETWIEAGALKSGISVTHEFYRAATALTLHADAGHLASNVFFGSIFLFLLARLCGIGRALFLAIAAGVCGNLLTVFSRGGWWKSIGFSTAVFACAGALGGIMLWRATSARKGLLTLGAPLALIALLGTEGANTDYLAHLYGALCGLVGGIAEGALMERGLAPGNIVSAAAALLILVLAWLAAFNII